MKWDSKSRTKDFMCLNLHKLNYKLDKYGYDTHINT